MCNLSKVRLSRAIFAVSGMLHQSTRITIRAYWGFLKAGNGGRVDFPFGAASLLIAFEGKPVAAIMLFRPKQ